MERFVILIDRIQGNKCYENKCSNPRSHEGTGPGECETELGSGLKGSGGGRGIVE